MIKRNNLGRALFCTGITISTLSFGAEVYSSTLGRDSEIDHYFEVKEAYENGGRTREVEEIFNGFENNTRFQTKIDDFYTMSLSRILVGSAGCGIFIAGGKLLEERTEEE